ncbi:hypothetical protein AB0G03_22075 [Micromonospora aurantiaca]|uniref:hypothetical protein n=1 Tax=Micromonospora aurantiaca (nom. illeg.) TaxID=47850 RepID=UPI0033C05E17
MPRTSEYAEAVYQFIQEHATIEDGCRVCREPLYPWMMEEFRLNRREVKGIRTAVVKELERRGLVHRPNPRSVLLMLKD